jgi:hypothetical protein
MCDSRFRRGGGRDQFAGRVNETWIAPSAEAPPTGTKGFGVFARETIPANTTVVGFGGSVVDGPAPRGLDDFRRRRALQLDDGLFLVGDLPYDPGDFVNHSCDPNCGMSGRSSLS